MNRPDPIHGWRAAPVQPAKSKKGWTVVFAMDSNGQRPALDYMQGVDPASDEKHPFTPKQRDTMLGYVAAICLEGARSLSHGKQFKVFIGEDAKDGMCELRFGADQGHRLICFQRAPQQFVVACGFLKPPRWETPPEHKKRGRQVLAAHQKLEQSAKTRRKHGH